MEYLCSLRWSGNIRQLANAVEQCCVLSTAGLIPLSLVQKAVSDGMASIPHWPRPGVSLNGITWKSCCG
jgi:two-component system response regulator GlrR